MAAYRELAPPPALDAHIACLWTSHDGPVRVLPDACVDIVLTSERLVVAGPATGPHHAPPTPGQGRVGLRFRVGSAGAALGVGADVLLDEHAVPLAELWGASAARRLEDRLARAPSPEAAAVVLARGVADRLPPPAGGDPLVRAAVARLRGPDPPALPALGRAIGLGERQLRRRFEHAVGYGPATLVRVARFQRFLALAQAMPATTLARLAADAGYADQAHLARDCRRLAGLAPSALLAAGAAPAGERSGSFKAPRAHRGTLAA